MRILHLLFLASALLFPQLALAQSECKFAYEERLIESTGAAFQILDLDGNPTTIKGNWTPIRARGLNDRIRKFARSIGRMDVCWENEDGKSAITYCTATLLDKNRILTNFHCTNPGEGSRLTQLGYFAVDARLLMGFEDQFETEGVSSYRVVLPARIGSPVDEADAQIFKVLGKPNIKWGETKLRVADRFDAGEAMIIVHHPAGMVKMFSSVRCNIKDSQAKAADNVIRHECDTAGGSSGSLLLRERDLAIVGLHHQGGLTAEDHRSFNQAIRFGFVAEKMALAVMVEEGDNAAANSSGVAAKTACDQLFETAERMSQCVAWKAYLQQCKNHALAAIGQAFVSNTCVADVTETVVSDPSATSSLQSRMAASSVVQDCDRLAGHPGHPDKKSGLMLQDGVKMDDINSSLAEIACRSALKIFSDQPRLLLNLGRALASAGNNYSAAEFYRLAANLNDAFAMSSLGVVFQRGHGVTKDVVEAARWYRKAAELGSARGQNNLGFMYKNGIGVEKDYAQAVHWFRKAEEQEYDHAQTNLGLMYEKGLGVAKDPDLAADFYFAAIANGNEWPITRNAVHWDTKTAKALQLKLREVGLYSDAIDGNLGGPNSKAAMRKLAEGG